MLQFVSSNTFPSVLIQSCFVQTAVMATSVTEHTLVHPSCERKHLVLYLPQNCDGSSLVNWQETNLELANVGCVRKGEKTWWHAAWTTYQPAEFLLFFFFFQKICFWWGIKLSRKSNWHKLLQKRGVKGKFTHLFAHRDLITVMQALYHTLENHDSTRINYM